jgi:hypothetical protein
MAFETEYDGMDSLSDAGRLVADGVTAQLDEPSRGALITVSEDRIHTAVAAYPIAALCRINYARLYNIP